jgi:hypothetical protein
MKKGLLILVSMILVCSAFAFNQGTINLGGMADFSIDKANSDADPITTIRLRPQVAYFVRDNISADLIFIMENQSQDDDNITALGFGLGGRYFWNQLYAGADIQYHSVAMDTGLTGKNTTTGIYLTPKVGYLIPLVQNVFFDVRALYQLGVGDYGGDASGSNESSWLNLSVGLQVFLNR